MEDVIWELVKEAETEIGRIYLNHIDAKDGSLMVIDKMLKAIKEVKVSFYDKLKDVFVEVSKAKLR